MANYESNKNRKVMLSAINWWEEESSRLKVIRIIAYLLFAASISGTIYAAVKGALPAWGVTLYVFFAVELVFLTFMYAIRHSGDAEIRRSIFELRLKREMQWEFERSMLAEFVRLTACLTSGIDPELRPPLSQRGRRVAPKLPFPTVDRNEEAKELIRQAVEPYFKNALQDSLPSEQLEATVANSNEISLDFIAYSSETLIELSRDMTAELDELLSSGDGTLDGVDIHVRILVRDTSPDGQWLIPLARNDAADAEYAADLRTRFRNVQRSELKRFEETLKNLVAPKQVHFFVRGYRVEPLFKGIMLNQSRGMFGLYKISDLQDPSGWDYSGHDIDFCRIEQEGGSFQTAVIHFFNDWFELMWNDVYSRPIEK